MGKHKEVPESSRLEFLQEFLANNFALSDAEDNTSGLLNGTGIADLPFLRTLSAIHQKSREPGFWEVMDSSVWLAYASSAATKTKCGNFIVTLGGNFKDRRENGDIFPKKIVGTLKEFHWLLY